MKEYEKEYPLISIHIPKAGGTSFLSVLAAWFGKKLYTHYFDAKQGKLPKKRNLRYGLLKRKFKKGICIHGHFNKKRGFGVSEYYPEARQFITILRNPLELALSHYFYLKEFGNFMFRKGTDSDITNRYKNVDDYLENHHSYILQHFPFDLSIDNYEEILDKYFVYIGILEDFQVSTNMLAKKLGFPEVKVSWRNAARRDEDVSEMVINDFIGRHRLEFAIYEFAIKRYRDSEKDQQWI